MAPTYDDHDGEALYASFRTSDAFFLTTDQHGCPCLDDLPGLPVLQVDQILLRYPAIRGRLDSQVGAFAAVWFPFQDAVSCCTMSRQSDELTTCL